MKKWRKKQKIAKITMLVFLKYTKQFHFHTDSSNYQLEVTISQGGNIIADFQKN